MINAELLSMPKIFQLIIKSQHLHLYSSYTITGYTYILIYDTRFHETF
jgi:hypothetical protein